MKKIIFDSVSEKLHPLVMENKEQWFGVQKIFKFKNGYGASIIRYGRKKVKFPLIRPTKDGGEYFSFTNNDKEWELCIIKDGQLCYDTPITNDVIGYLKKEQVEEILRKIKAL